MFFALGFFVAALLTLLVLPAVSRRAERLARRRLEMVMPLSMAEVAAERDQLRAEFAAEKRRIEQHSEALVEARARDMSELGRRATVIADLGSDLAEVKQSKLELDASLQAGEERFRQLEAELAAVQKEYYDSSGLLERRTRTVIELELARQHYGEISDEHRTMVAGLETRAAGLEMRLDDLQHELQTKQALLNTRSLELERAVEARDFSKTETAAIAARLAALQLVYEQQGEQLRALEEDLVGHRRSRMRAEAKAEAAERLAADAAEREQAARDWRGRQSEVTRAGESNLARRMESMRAERDGLRGALEAMRNEYALVREELAAARSRPLPLSDKSPPEKKANGQDSDTGHKAPTVPTEEDLALLRQAIADIGTEVARLATTLDEEAATNGENTPIDLAQRLRALQDRSHRAAQTG